MNLNEMRRHSSGDTLDAVIIGTGAGGAPLLAWLAKAGLSVVALEAGPNFDPEEFAADEAEADLYWLDERLSGGDTPEAFGANNSGKGVGGSTLHWGAFVPRADKRDLLLQTTSGVGEDWPLRYEDLVPYYESVEAFIGVSGPGRYPWDNTRQYAYPPVPRNAPAQLMARGCEALGICAADAPAAVLSRAVQQPNGPFRQACINCGYCHQGCRVGAKTSMDVTYLPWAVAEGAEIRPNCMVHGIERNDLGAITAVIYRQGGVDHRQRCHAVFLCAGAIETPRLLLHWGIANASGQVGRNYMAHVATQIWGTFDQEIRCHKGYPSSLITEDLVRPADAAFEGGYLIQSLGVVPVTWATGLARGRGLWGQPLIDAIHGYNRVAGLGINGECLADPGNFLDLADEVDELGLRKARIQFSYGRNEMAMQEHATRLMTSIWEAAGASDIFAVQRSAHTIGTCRMGTDPARAVVNDVGRCFDVPNLWICDNSVFPTSLSANPALTIMALSLRSADAFLRQARL